MSKLGKIFIKRRLKKYKEKNFVPEIADFSLLEENENVSTVFLDEPLVVYLAKDYGIAMCQYLINENKYTIQELQEIVGKLENCKATKLYGDYFMKGYVCGLMMTGTSEYNLFVRLFRSRVFKVNKKLETFFRKETFNEIIAGVVEVILDILNIFVPLFG